MMWDAITHSWFPIGQMMVNRFHYFYRIMFVNECVVQYIYNYDTTYTHDLSNNVLVLFYEEKK